jgi:hypothetical protein
MTGTANRIAAVEGASGAAVQRLFEEAVARWRGAGLRVVGVIEETHGLPDRTCSAGFLRDIGSGTRHSIFLERPPRDASCHIDAAGAQRAGAAVLAQIAASDLVVLSKFGKLEAAGGGLMAVFRAAVAAGKPVLTAVSSVHRDTWHAFAPQAAALAPTSAALEEWWTAGRQH